MNFQQFSRVIGADIKKFFNNFSQKMKSVLDEKNIGGSKQNRITTLLFLHNLRITSENNTRSIRRNPKIKKIVRMMSHPSTTTLRSMSSKNTFKSPFTVLSALKY